MQDIKSISYICCSNNDHWQCLEVRHIKCASLSDDYESSHLALASTIAIDIVEISITMVYILVIIWIIVVHLHCFRFSNISSCMLFHFSLPIKRGKNQLAIKSLLLYMWNYWIYKFIIKKIYYMTKIFQNLGLSDRIQQGTCRISKSGSSKLIVWVSIRLSFSWFPFSLFRIEMLCNWVS